MITSRVPYNLTTKLQLNKALIALIIKHCPCIAKSKYLVDTLQTITGLNRSSICQHIILFCLTAALCFEFCFLVSSFSLSTKPVGHAEETLVLLRTRLIAACLQTQGNWMNAEMRSRSRSGIKEKERDRN